MASGHSHCRGTFPSCWKSLMMLRAVVQPLLLCLVLSVLMVHGLEDVQPSACSGLVDQIQGDNVLVRINGTLMTFHVPSKPGGPFNDHAVQYLEVPNLRELNRTGETCSRNTDPTLVTLSFAGCSCALSDTSEVANGVNKTARTLTISNCPPPYSQVVTTMLISTTNVTSELFYNETMPYSSAANFSYSNPAGGVKFGLHVANWNWSVSGVKEQNNSYVTFGLVFGVRDQENIQVLPSGPQDYQLVTQYDGFKIILSLDWGIVLDGRGAIFAYKTVDQPLTLTGASTGDTWFGFNTSVSFCEPTPYDAGIILPGRYPLGRWNTMFYDPSLQVLFSDFGAPSNNRKWVLAVSIALPIVAVLIILTIVLLVIFVPSIKNFFMPYNRENMETKRHSKRDVHATDDNAKEWRRSKTPNA